VSVGRAARGAPVGLWMALSLLGAAVPPAGCGAPSSGPSPADARRAHERLVAHERQVDELARRIDAYRDGWTRSYEETWRTALEGAREAGPPTFRARVAREALVVGLVLFGLGFLARLVLGGPRRGWRRGRAGATGAQETRPPSRRPAPQEGWPAVLAALWRLVRGGVVGLVRIFVGPRAPADGCCPEVLHARTAERLLTDAARAAAALAGLVEGRGPLAPDASPEASVPADGGAGQGEPGAVLDAGDARAPGAEAPRDAAAVAGRARALATALDAWRADVSRVRRAQEEGRGRTGARALRETLRETAQRADELRVGLQRALLRGEVPGEATWGAWESDVERRPRLPKRAAEPVPETIFTWTHASLGLAAAAVVALGGWAAAGAIPAWIALLLAAGTVGAWVGAGARLRAAGRDRLLPGAATALARRLVGFVGVVGLVAGLSATTSAESGLNLGLPPRVPEADSVPTPAPPITALPRPRAFPAPAPLPPPSAKASRARDGAPGPTARDGSTPHPAAAPGPAEEAPAP